VCQFYMEFTKQQEDSGSLTIINGKPRIYYYPCSCLLSGAKNVHTVGHPSSQSCHSSTVSMKASPTSPSPAICATDINPLPPEVVMGKNFKKHTKRMENFQRRYGRRITQSIFAELATIMSTDALDGDALTEPSRREHYMHPRSKFQKQCYEDACEIINEVALDLTTVNWKAKLGASSRMGCQSQGNFTTSSILISP
jgi:hypothetical protein